MIDEALGVAIAGTSWGAYVRRVAGPHASQAAIAYRSGVSQNVVSRWLQETALPKPVTALRFAHAYKRPIIETYIAAGWLTENDVDLYLAQKDQSSLP